VSHIEHPVFGKIIFDLSWEGELDINIFGQSKKVILYIHGDEKGEFKEGQIEAFQNFMDKCSDLLELSEEDIFKYYLDNNNEIREILEDSTDGLAPHIKDKKELSQLLVPTHLLIREVLDDGIRVVGLLFDCTWDTSHGLAVRYENEEITEVGPQDILL
jgi:hypothetical protein